MQDRRGTWFQALASLAFPILLILGLRWFLWEPYVIPSQSMAPTLMKNDFVLVDKLSYGLRVPFTSNWLLSWGAPKRGEVVVFRYPKNRKIYFVKRVIGLPGDQVEVSLNGQVKINGESWFRPGESKKTPLARRGWSRFDVPKGHLFVLGDNRDNSSDSRVWGFAPVEDLMGPVRWIWLSCGQRVEGVSFLCDWSTLREERIFTKVL